MDTDKESKKDCLEIDELHVFEEEGDDYNFYTVNSASNMPPGHHACKNEWYNSNGYAGLRHYYDIPYKLKHVINLYYKVKRFTCLSCNHTFAIPITFADEKSKRHYTYRFEKWIAQQCLANPFSQVSEAVMKIPPWELTEQNKDAEKIISESGIKKLFRLWIEKQDAKFLKDMATFRVIGIHKAHIRSKEIYLLTSIKPENNYSGTVMWLSDNLRELKTTLKEIYNNDGIVFPDRILVDWDPSCELISFTQKLFPYSEIMIDFKRVPKYMRECIDASGEKLSADDLEYLERCIWHLEEVSQDDACDDSTIWREIEKHLRDDFLAPLWKEKNCIKDSLWPQRIETDGDYWDYVHDIQYMLQNNDHGCSVDALRARILYKEKQPYTEEADAYRSVKMTAKFAQYYLEFFASHDKKYVFPRFSRKVFSNTPSDPFINCLYYDRFHINYGVPFETALANLRSTVLYHEAYDYYLAHPEEVERVLSEWKEDEFFYEEPDDI